MIASIDMPSNDVTGNAYSGDLTRDLTELFSKSGQMPWKQSPINGPNHAIWFKERFISACAHVAYSTRSFKVACLRFLWLYGSSTNVRIIGRADRYVWYFTQTSKIRLRVSFRSGPTSPFAEVMSRKIDDTPRVCESTLSQ